MIEGRTTPAKKISRRRRTGPGTSAPAPRAPVDRDVPLWAPQGIRKMNLARGTSREVAREVAREVPGKCVA